MSATKNKKNNNGKRGLKNETKKRTVGEKCTENLKDSQKNTPDIKTYTWNP